jgi:hypothetical protein
MTSASLEARSLRVSALVGLVADLVTVHTTAPLPPGTRVRLALEVSDHAPPLAPVGKVVGLERLGPETFVVRVRLHSLSRGDRTALEQLVRRGAG